MQAKDSLNAIPLTELAPPVPELPVRDVEAARAHYRDKLGFELGWVVEGNEIGSVHRGHVAIFFRRRSAPFEPTVHWMFAPKIAETYAEMQARGARITDPLEKKPWGMTQFTIEDPDGNRFYVHCD